MQEVAASGLCELASGVDALYMSGHGTVATGFLDRLEAARQRAEERDAPVSFDLEGIAVELAPRAFGRYRYLLETEHGRIGVTGSKSLPPVRIQPLAEHLHGVGPVASMAWFEAVVGSFTHDLRLSATRLDLFSDWHGLNLQAADRTRFVGRGTRLDTHEEGGDLTGFEFGRRTTRTVVARIYDKTLEVGRKGSLWWRDLWGPAYEPGQQVLRVEFEFGRKGVGQYGVDSALQAIEAAPSLWLAASVHWLSLRVPTADRTRARWPVDPAWALVQRPGFTENALGLKRIREGRGEGTLRSIMPGLVGYLASFCALAGGDSLEDVLDVLCMAVADPELIAGASFENRVVEKRKQQRQALLRRGLLREVQS